MLKTYKCNQTQDEEYPLSWEEVRAHEGVYIQRGSTGRLIVLSVNCHVWWARGDLYACNAQESSKFKRTEERIYMDIK